MTPEEMLKERSLPPLLPREEMKALLLRDEYGEEPSIPYEVTHSEPRPIEGRLCSFKAKLSEVDFTVKTALGAHTFTVKRLLHEDGKKHPFFVFMNFREAAPDFYYPVEEIAENGFSVLSFCYKSVTSDDGDFSNGLAGILLPEGREKPTSSGKLMLWAFTASRVLDYAKSIPSLDMEAAAVVGHSRLGKTALLAAMLDERFQYAFSNDSGCSGASLSRGNLGLLGKRGLYNTGETIASIVKNFPFWFCPAYPQFAKEGYSPLFDQHFLIASIAPRHAYVASASMDDWADPTSEFLSCLAASAAYEALGYKGLVAKDRLPEIGERYHEGRIGYHLREGAHFLSRHDWNSFMDYIKRHQNL